MVHLTNSLARQTFDKKGIDGAQQDFLVLLTDFINGLYLAQEPTVLIRNDTVARLGNVLTETDANSNVTNQTYDGLNRRTRTTDSLGTIMEAGYDKGAFNSPLHHG